MRVDRRLLIYIHHTISAAGLTAMPVLFALYRKPKDCDRRHPFKTRQQLAAQMIRQAHDALPGWTLRVAADGQYATKQVIGPLPPGVNLVSRLRRDAALYELPPKKHGRGRGRPPKKGRRLPTPRQMARRRKKGWQTIQVRKGSRTVERRVLAILCLWYHTCKDKPIKFVIVRDPEGQQQDDFFFCTDPTLCCARIFLLCLRQRPCHILPGDRRECPERDHPIMSRWTA